MNRTYFFEAVDRLSDQYPVPATLVWVYGCEPVRMHVATILEPRSVNPSILIERPLGLSAVREIIDALKLSQMETAG